LCDLIEEALTQSTLPNRAKSLPLSIQREQASIELANDVKAPQYLVAHYSWAYIHPRAIRLFERQWLVNLILWGNYRRLSGIVLAELEQIFPCATLQVGCVYGDLTNRLSTQATATKSELDVIDILPMQLTNLHGKLPRDATVRMLRMDSTDLRLPDASYDQALLFFLLHEQPSHLRELTMSEVFRVVRPGGKIVIVDYARPRFWNPLRYLWRPLLGLLEPFALDLWRHEIPYWFPVEVPVRWNKQSFFGGLYQKIVITR
jgi:ubiquinone/menaquinone biosynthesis C-methylase UbiE